MVWGWVARQDDVCSPACCCLSAFHNMDMALGRRRASCTPSEGIGMSLQAACTGQVGKDCIPSRGPAECLAEAFICSSWHKLVWVQGCLCSCTFSGGHLPHREPGIALQPRNGQSTECIVALTLTLTQTFAFPSGTGSVGTPSPSQHGGHLTTAPGQSIPESFSCCRMASGGPEWNLIST